MVGFVVHVVARSGIRYTAFFFRIFGRLCFSTARHAFEARAMATDRFFILVSGLISRAGDSASVVVIFRRFRFATFKPKIRVSGTIFVARIRQGCM